MAAREPASPVGQGGRLFATTRWSVVLQAGGPTSHGSAAALEQLCRTYWYPLYSFARRSGLPAHDARHGALVGRVWADGPVEGSPNPD